MFYQRILAFIMALILSLPFNIGHYFKKENAQADDNIKNVIYVIGDGMGANHLAKAKKDLNLQMNTDRMTYSGWSVTTSVTGTTDSAAGGTALSCGIKTINSYVGVYSYDPLRVSSTPKSITEICRDHGMKTGVVTTDGVAGATPAAFTAHTSSRDNKDDICNQQALSDFDLIWGRKAANVNKALLSENGYTVFSTKEEMLALEKGGKSYGQIYDEFWSPDLDNPESEDYEEGLPTLSLMTEKAIELLEGSEEGFFLMVEAAHIDKHSHDSDGEKMVKSVEELNNTLDVVLDFAEEDGNTLVVLTADHETGGLKPMCNGYKFTSYGSHTGVNVPLYVYGSDKIIADGETTINSYIPRKIVTVLGFDVNEFEAA